MAIKTKSGLNLYNWATDSTQDFVNGTVGITDGNNPSSMEVIDKFMQEKITLDGKKDSQSNFNFIENRVANSYLYLRENFKVKDTIPINSTEIHVFLNTYFSDITDFDYLKIGNINISVYKNNNGYRVSDGTTTRYSSKINRNNNAYNTLYIKLSANNKILLSDGQNEEEIDITTFNGVGSNAYVYYYGTITNETTKTMAMYNNISKQEMQHNFAVLNNSPSVNQLQVTDNEGSKMPLLFASDTSHVEGRGGVLQDQINADFYKQFCKEFTSADGSDITVANGMRGYVNSFAMSGQTVKNNVISNTSTPVTISQGQTITTLYTINSLELNKTYTVCFEVVSVGTIPSELRIIGIRPNANNLIVNIDRIGMYTVVVPSLRSVMASINYYLNTGTNITVKNLAVYDGDVSKIVNAYTPFGLSSTKASITNNGIKYNFYGLDSNVITLGGVGGVNDTLTLNDDGSGMWNHNVSYQLITESSNITFNSGGTDQYLTDRAMFDVQVDGTSATNKPADIIVISNRFNGVSYNDRNSDFELVSCLPKAIRVTINKDKLDTPDLIGFKKWLLSNPITVIYQLATPTTTTIPKEVNSPVLTADKSNILTAGDSVKASGFKVNAPVDKFSELYNRLETMENVINTQSNTQLLANFADDEYNKIMNGEVMHNV